MQEAEILQQALSSLELLTGAEGIIEPLDQQQEDYRWDAVLHLKAGSASGEFKAEVKASILPATLTNLLDKLKSQNGLLVARYISGPAKAILEGQRINYLDVAGNCFIHSDQGLFWMIRGQSMPEETKVLKHEAFHKNGIKLLYALLLREDWLNEPYRFLAEKARIAPSTIGDIFNDLKASRFLGQINEEQRVLFRSHELLAQWANAFCKKLKPKLSRGKFRFAKKEILQEWKKLDLGPSAFWGGEPAAHLLSGYLKPAIWTIYTNLDRKALLTDLYLVPDPKNGEVELYQLFWNEQEDSFIDSTLRTVSPLLVYADLIGTGDNRNLETANRIYEQFIRGVFE